MEEKRPIVSPSDAQRQASAAGSADEDPVVAPAEQNADEETNQVDADSWHSGVACTLALLGLMGFVFFISMLRSAAEGGSGASVPPAVLSSLGGNLAFLTLTGDWWRLLTNVFLHASLVHLLFNAAVFYWLGGVMERSLGRAPLLCIFVVGGLWSSWASACWNGSRTFGSADKLNLVVSVGASGAIMAVLAALLVLMNSRSQNPALRMPESLPRSINGTLLQLLGVNLLVGLFTPGVDQAAHIGGLLAGFGLAMAALALGGRRYVVGRPRVLLASVLASAFLLLFLALALPSWSRLQPLRDEWDASEALNRRIEDEQQQEARAERQAKERMQRSETTRKKNASILRRKLPVPVTDAEAAGSSQSVQQLDPNLLKEFFPQDPPEGYVNRRAPDDLLMHVWGPQLILQPRTERRDTVTDDAKTWGLCHARYSGFQFYVKAAFSDGKGRDWIASATHEYVRVTDLATGVDIGVYPIPGEPDQVGFDAAGERLLVITAGRAVGFATLLNLKQRMRVPSGSAAADPMLCGWP